MDTGSLGCYHLTLPSYLPSKNKHFDWRGRCTRFAWRLLFDINHQLSTGAGSPSKPLRPTFFPSRNKYKATISHYQTLYIERIPTREIQGKRHACANNSLLRCCLWRLSSLNFYCYILRLICLPWGDNLAAGYR